MYYKLIKYLGHKFPVLHTLHIALLSKKRLIYRLTHPFSWYNLRSVKPVSNLYGLDRGQSVDRFYIESFLRQNRGLVKGKVLEVLDDFYTREFGGKKVTHSDILDIDKRNKFATVYDDLRNLKKIKPNTYDCLILTQVFQFIDDNPSAIRQCFKILKKGGTLLVTLPCFSRADVASGVSGDYWRYTTAGAKFLFEPVFGKRNVQVSSWGNVLSGTAYWQGISLEELRQNEVKHRDKNFPVVVGVKATKI